MTHYPQYLSDNAAMLERNEDILVDLSVGEYLKEMRAMQEWSFRELGRRSGLPIASLSMYESGKRPISLTAAKKLARAFGMTSPICFLDLSMGE